MSPEHEVPNPENSAGVSRRDVIIKGGIAVAGVGLLIKESATLGGWVGDGMDAVADFIYPQPDSSANHQSQTDAHTEGGSELNTVSEGLNQEVDSSVDQALNSPEHGETHSENPEAIDWIGTAVFAHGIKELYKGNSITQGHYFSQGALVAIKRHEARARGDEETVHHIDEELAATINFTAIIEGTVVVAEGMMLDVESIYQRVTNQEDLSLQDRVAIVTELASILAPITTTVGASGMTTKETSKIIEQAQVFADRMVEDTLTSIDGLSPEQREEAPNQNQSISRIKALLQSHISDKAGFPFFGDPPFIATIERFGIQGLLWQSLNVGMVPALRSLQYTNTIITKELISLGAIDAQGQKPSKIANSAMKRNFGFVSSVMGRSAKNLFAPLVGKGQDENGMQHDILGAFADKVDGFRDLLVEEHIASHGHEDEGTRIEDAGKYEEFITGVIANLPDQSDAHSYERVGMQRDIRHFIANEDFEGLKNWMVERNLDTRLADAFIASAIEVEREIENQQGFEGNEIHKWNPVSVYRRVTDITRMQRALGHSFTDVLDVFPFQSVSMIFVSPVFKYLVGKYDKITEKIPTKIARDLVNDLGKYAGIAGFSSVADNLVGVREGFKFTEHNPSIALIAGIQGGMLLPPGNMANVVSFPLDEYPLEEAKGQIKSIHLKPLAEGFVWSQILGLTDKTGIGFLKFPEPKIQDDSSHGEETGAHAQGVRSSGNAKTRRDLFKSIIGGQRTL